MRPSRFARKLPAHAVLETHRTARRATNKLRPRRLLAYVLSLGMFSACATAEMGGGLPYAVDNSHTRIMFDVAHLGFSTMPGIFRDFDVDLQFDAERPERSSLAVTIQSASVDMFHDGLNTHLRKPDFFAVEKFPTITFTSTKVVPGPDNTATVTGDFTMLGVTRPLVLDVKLNQLGKHPMRGKDWVGFDATGELDRTAWGMSSYAPAIGTNIRFRISTEGELVTKSAM